MRIIGFYCPPRIALEVDRDESFEFRLHEFARYLREMLGKLEEERWAEMRKKWREEWEPIIQVSVVHSEMESPHLVACCMDTPLLTGNEPTDQEVRPAHPVLQSGIRGDGINAKMLNRVDDSPKNIVPYSESWCADHTEPTSKSKQNSVLLDFQSRRSNEVLKFGTERIVFNLGVNDMYT